MMKVIVVFKRLLASGNDQHGRHLFKWGNRWNSFGFNFTKRDALSSVYKISMDTTGHFISVININREF
jgi:hypothetical protein